MASRKAQPGITDEEGQEVEDIMVEVTERAAGYYEVQKVEFGKVYRWRPGGGVVPECCCGPALSDPAEAGCTLHPWRYYADACEEVGLAF